MYSLCNGFGVEGQTAIHFDRYFVKQLNIFMVKLFAT